MEDLNLVNRDHLRISPMVTGNEPITVRYIIVDSPYRMYNRLPAVTWRTLIGQLLVTVGEILKWSRLQFDGLKYKFSQFHQTVFPKIVNDFLTIITLY